MKKIGIALCILTILCGCTSAGTPEEVLEDDQEVQGNTGNAGSDAGGTHFGRQQQTFFCKQF